MKHDPDFSVPLDPELQTAIEKVLHEGETVSRFVEKSVRYEIRERKEFITRGSASAEEAKRTGVYFPADEVPDELHAALKQVQEITADNTAGLGASRIRERSSGVLLGDVSVRNLIDDGRK